MTGKSTYLHDVYPRAQYYDFLKTDVFFHYNQAPYSLREEVLALSPEQLKYPVILDEVQKVPIILNEIHWLIENSQAFFILCGSSARKLKKGAANLLGGRAWHYTFYPLVYHEVPQFDLLHALQTGLIPAHYLAENITKSLQAYIVNYLKEEIQGEALTRNLTAFARFIDILPFSHGELVNFSNIARECAIDAKTVKEYYQILVDTLMGYFIEPYHKKAKRQVIVATPKFYLFDVGVANYLAKRHITELKGSAAGKAFEHFLLMELIAYRGINDKDFPINYWRTKTGLEVDFILDDGKIAIEVKINDKIRQSDVKGLLAFLQEYPHAQGFVVCQAMRKRKIVIDSHTSITVLPWQEFLELLWQGKLGAVV